MFSSSGSDAALEAGVDIESELEGVGGAGVEEGDTVLGVEGAEGAVGLLPKSARILSIEFGI